MEGPKWDVHIQAVVTSVVLYLFASLAYNHGANGTDVVAIVTAVGTGIYAINFLKSRIDKKKDDDSDK